ncbi:MAG: hypothetical protein BIFFINMI_01502 [Phycisphaerae bacterium]|nr:hypothetical protein [Phycisphaerae bacterium]
MPRIPSRFHPDRHASDALPGLRARLCLGLVAAGAICTLLAGCGYAPTAADKAVMDARAGRVLTPPGHGLGGVAVVYSYREDINVKYDYEKWHPHDLHRGRKIYDQLVADKALTPEDVFVPGAADDNMLLRVHQREYLASLANKHVAAALMESNVASLQSDKDYTERVLAPYRVDVGGTVLSAELAKIHGMAIHLGGGQKHASTDRGARSDLLADVPIAMDMLRERKLADRILVIDLGASQANGIAVCTAEQENTYLFDVYEKSNYPKAKQLENGGVAIDDGIGDGEYLAILRARLPKILDDFKPDFVFYLAGADVVGGDLEGRSKLTPAGMTERDLYVAEQARSREIPLCVVLDGGWAQDAWRLYYRSIRALLARYGGVEFRVPLAEK